MIQRFQIYPKHCNPMKIGDDFMCHGGTILGEADRIAAILVNELLHDKNMYGLTVGADKLQFYAGPMCGDTLTIKATLFDFGKSRITIYVVMQDQHETKVFDGRYSFCSFLKDENGRPKLSVKGKPIMVEHGF